MHKYEVGINAARHAQCVGVLVGCDTLIGFDVCERHEEGITSMPGVGADVVAVSNFEPYVVDVADALGDSMEAMATTREQESLEGVISALADCGDTCSKLFIDEVVSKFNDG